MIAGGFLLVGYDEILTFRKEKKSELKNRTLRSFGSIFVFQSSCVCG